MEHSLLRRKRSDIWTLFSPVVGKTSRAKCDTCGNIYSFSGGSTSNLALHVRTKHPSLAEGLPRGKRQRTSAVDRLGQGVSVDNRAANSCRITTKAAAAPHRKRAIYGKRGRIHTRGFHI